MKTRQPRFATANPMGAAMQLAPPFAFDGVTLRVFPLRANLYHLQRFVDGLLNIVPPQVARFRVPLPYAFMSLINYGKMSVDAANMGWIAQREILFCIPLEWYRLEGGKYVFQDWAFVSPFIYVDNELSMATGRNVYGWPKSLAVLDAELNAWMDNPRARSRLATASTMVFPEAYKGQRQEQRVFLEVKQSLGPSPLQVPPDLGGAAMPWVAVPNAVRSSASLLRDYVGLFGAMGLTERQPYVGPQAFASMARQIGRGVNPFGPGLALNTVNLKQFRSADNPSAIAYQALTNARMEMKAYRSGGLMGDGNMLLGDSSGGFRVLLHRYKATPIIESLGLEVDSEWQGNGVGVASLKPVFPYWLDVDMNYNRGDTLAWRTKVTDGWMVGHGDAAKRYARDGENGPGPIRNPYNTSTAGASQEIGGALEFPDTTFCVLPLMADKQRLEALLEGYLNEPLRSEDMRFEPWGRYVYLVVANHSGVSSDSNNIGSWADHDVKVYVAVKWYAREDGAPEGSEPTLRGVALVPVFAYANSTTATITSTEVTGIPVMKAVVECPSGTWLDASGPGEATTDPLLRMTTTVLPVLGEGQGAQERVVLEIKDGTIPGLSEEGAWRRVAEKWGAALKQDLAAAWKLRADHPEAFDDALTLPLEVFGQGEPLNIITLKQFRETSDPDAACYQSLVLHRWEVEHIRDVREIETNLYACIHEYPTQPIVQTLGLVAKHVTTTGAARAHYVEPVRPFWFRQSQRQQLGMTIRRRAGSEQWERDPDTEAMKYVPYFHGQPSVEEGLGGRMYPQRIKAQVQGIIELGVAPGTCAPSPEDGEPVRAPGPLSKKRAAAAIEAMEPQVILGALLSREWENWGKPRWQMERDAVDRELKAADRDALPRDVANAQVSVLRRKLKECNLAEEARGMPTGSSRRSHRDELFRSLLAAARALTKLSLERVPLPPSLARPGALSARVKAKRDTAPATQLGEHPDQIDTELLRDVLAAASDDDIYRTVLRVLPRIPVESRSGAEPNDMKKALGVLQTAVELLIEATPHPRGEDPTVIDDRLLRAERLLPLVHALSESVRRRLTATITEDVKEQYARCLQGIVYEVALSAQKPDHCIRRQTLAAPEQAYVLPDDQCWDADKGLWFVGPMEPARARTVLKVTRSVGGAAMPSTDTFNDWSDADELGTIRKVTIWAGDVVDAVRVGYEDRSLEKHGGSGGSKHEVTLGTADALVGLSLSHGYYFGKKHLCGVTVEILDGQGNTRRAGPFASGRFATQVTTTDLKAADGEEIAALSGGSYLHTDGMEALTTLGVTFARSPATRP